MFDRIDRLEYSSLDVVMNDDFGLTDFDEALEEAAEDDSEEVAEDDDVATLGPHRSGAGEGEPLQPLLVDVVLAGLGGRALKGTALVEDSNRDHS